MDKKNLMPQVAQPVNRTTAGQMPPELAELSEEALQQHGEGTAYSTSVLASNYAIGRQGCSYDGDDAE
jgi:bacteriocin leader peptide (microcyclamide/patellamide family)